MSYHPPEMLSFIYCLECLVVFISKSEKAQELYDRIVDCYDLPGCRDVCATMININVDNLTDDHGCPCGMQLQNWN